MPKNLPGTAQSRSLGLSEASAPSHVITNVLRARFFTSTSCLGVRQGNMFDSAWLCLHWRCLQVHANPALHFCSHTQLVLSHFHTRRCGASPALPDGDLDRPLQMASPIVKAQTKELPTNKVGESKLELPSQPCHAFRNVLMDLR